MAQAQTRSKPSNSEEDTGDRWPCPKCDKNPVRRSDETCEECLAEARAGEEDAKTQSQARQAEAKKPPPATPGRPAQPQKPAPASGKRMTLAAVRDGAVEFPYRIALYGVEGIGKSTFGADAPDPIFVPAEESSNILAPKFPKPESWEDVIDAVRELGTQQHDFKTVVFDTVDKIEPLAWDVVVREDNERQTKGARSRNIEDVGGGYMKGYVAALQKWRYLMAMLERLQAAKKMNVIFLGHSHVKTVNNPEGENYDRYELKVHAKLAALIREWVEMVGFANNRIRVKTDRRGRSLRKAEMDEQRLITTVRTAAAEAKNRYGLPATIPLDFATFDRMVQENRTPEALIQFVRDKTALIDDPAITAWVDGELAKQPNVSKLTRINNRLATKLEEIESAREEAEAAAADD